MVVVSTSQGLMSGDDARKANIGGELILKVF
jgi:ribosomal protein S8